MARQKTDSPSFQSIMAELKQAKYHPIYFLNGEEAYFIDAISDFIEKHALTESEKAFNQLVLYGKEIEFKQVMDSARQFPMMANRRVVIVKEAQEMSTLNSLEPYFKNPSPQTILVINYKHKKLDKRTAFAKTVQQNSLFFESKKLYDNQVPQWVMNYLHQKGMEIDGRSAQLIAEYLGNDLTKLTNELGKLVLNLSDRKQITPEDIEVNIGISKDYNVFEFQNALGQKNKSKAVRIISYFISNPKKNPLIKINIILFNFFVKVYLTQSNPQLDDRSLAKVLKIGSTYFLKDYRTAARNFSSSKLESIFEHLLITDMRMKGINNHHVSDQELLKELTFHILAP